MCYWWNYWINLGIYDHENLKQRLRIRDVSFIQQYADWSRIVSGNWHTCRAFTGLASSSYGSSRSDAGVIIL